MKLLLTSDWQAQWTNLDKCEQIAKQIYTVCEEQGISAVIHAGDAKQIYNPVDLRVTNFIIRFCKGLTSRGIQLFCNLGNHDRSSMSKGSENWFPVLEAAGATTFQKATKTPVPLEQGYKLLAIPYQPDNAVLETMAKKVARLADKKSVLIFHNEIKGSRANVKSYLPSGLPIKKLFANKYHMCFGGHIHLHQQLDDNVWYIGSPFCQDWGEANQPKGFVVADLDKQTVKLIPSNLARYFDPTWPGFPKKRTQWAGHHVRIHVNIPENTNSVSAYIEKEKQKAAQQYPKAELTVVPEFVSREEQHSKYKGSDHENIKDYVAQTCPERFRQPKVVALLEYYLRLVGGFSSSDAKVTLLSAEGENVLSFKKIKADYKHQGITVVSGDNKDWPGHSNGSGKTSYLQLPVIGWFGTTLKGQANDAWSTKGSKKRAYLNLRFKISDGKVCRVHRSRHPAKLQLFVGKKDMSTGIGVRGTQAAIEQLTGLSFQSVSNAMYIDQGEVNALLTGSDATRKDLFSKFLSLDRFYKARDLIRLRLKSLEGLHDDADVTVRSCQQTIQSSQALLKALPAHVSVSAIKKGIASNTKAIVEVESALKKVAAEQQCLEETLTEAKHACDRSAKRAMKLAGSLQYHEEQLLATQSLTDPTCPTCLQPVDQTMLHKRHEEAEALVSKLEIKVAASNKEHEKLLKVVNDIKRKLSAVEDKETQWSRKIVAKKTAIQSLRNELATAKKLEASRKKLLTIIKKNTHTVRNVQQYHVMVNKEAEMLGYAVEAFSKNGLPMHLAGQLCPRLNAAAKTYSEVFAQSEIQVKFALEDDSVNVSVINIHGGERVKDQSQGELRMAGLIVGFALREVMNPCNVMILDEPGEGLDANNNKVFAQGLKQIANTLGPVIITSHQPYILTELENERLIEVTKRNGISTIKEPV